MYFDNKYEIVIIKKNIKNTYIRVKEDLKIYVTTNKYTKEKEIYKLIDNNYDGIIKNGMIQYKSPSPTYLPYGDYYLADALYRLKEYFEK